jgi:hypothetical protein
MDRKYTPHIRIPFSIFANPKYKQIPDTFKPYCLSVLVCLLKFVNAKTGKCYPRRQTIADMTGLSRTTIWKATVYLKKAKIIQIKRLSSTLLYTIDPDFIYGDVRIKNSDVRNRNIDVRNTNILIKLPLNKTNYITNIVREVISNNGYSKEDIINRLATLPPDRLRQAIKEKDNILYCKEALEVQSKKDTRLVDIPKIIVDNVRKRTNYFYKKKVHENKEDRARKNKTQNFLRGNDKDKH